MRIYLFVCFRFNMALVYREVCLVVVFGNNRAIDHEVKLSKGARRLSQKKHPVSQKLYRNWDHADSQQRHNFYFSWFTMVDVIESISSVFLGWEGKENVFQTIVHTQHDCSEVSRLYLVILKSKGKRYKIVPHPKITLILYLLNCQTWHVKMEKTYILII